MLYSKTSNPAKAPQCKSSGKTRFESIKANNEISNNSDNARLNPRKRASSTETKLNPMTNAFSVSLALNKRAYVIMMDAAAALKEKLPYPMFQKGGNFGDTLFPVD
ncbi:unnamed protein product [Leptosia nina]|uniref:Uncharacterized protein n=1 Tax=Leptosia nina TaxID=320188 RepID=A0AAV1J2F3_9NEOP